MIDTNNITALCYLKRGDELLFIVKGGKKDMNEGKYLGVGGHLEKGETARECILREIEEETGIVPDEIEDLKERGTIEFVNDYYGDEFMHVFEGNYIGTTDPAGRDYGEGVLVWVNKDKIHDLPLWEGDHIMFSKLFSEPGFFAMRLTYQKDVLKEVEIF